MTSDNSQSKAVHSNSKTNKLGRTICLFLALILICTLVTACASSNPSTKNDIVILYTNDVHCAIDENIGYAGLAAYKKSQEAKTPYVALVDCGDAIQGEIVGTVSKGAYPVQIMKEVGYDYAVLGNHEFDYGIDRVKELMPQSGATYLGCNITFSGEGENKLSAVKPYSIEKYGDKTVAFIGVSTPECLTKTRPVYFMDENGEFIYGFSGEASGNALYDCVQNTVNECREKGADYVVVLSHLGDNEESAPFRSIDLVDHTTGIDVVLDGHSHSVVPCRVEKNKNGDNVLISSTGTGLQNIGQLIITENGHISTGLVANYTDKDSETDSYIKSIQASYEADMNKVVANSDTALSINGADGIRLMRSREMPLGDFCADAYRAISGADIAVVNGGGIRADLPAGDITYADIIAIHPFGNTLCMVKASGQEILDCLETASRFTKKAVSENGNAVGECGGFLQVSGLKYTVDTSVPSSVQLDDNGMFVSVDGEYRVKDVSILNADGEYVPLDLSATYTLASHNFLIKNGGDGLNMFADNDFVIDEGITDNEMLITYITENLGGDLSRYAAGTDNRITVK